MKLSLILRLGCLPRRPVLGTQVVPGRFLSAGSPPSEDRSHSERKYLVDIAGMKAHVPASINVEVISCGTENTTRSVALSIDNKSKYKYLGFYTFGRNIMNYVYNIIDLYIP